MQDAISKSSLKNIEKKLSVAAKEKKVKKGEKAKGPARSKKPFACIVSEGPQKTEYDLTVDAIKSHIGTLDNFRVCTIHNKYFAVDSYCGAPIPFNLWSIPLNGVSRYREQGLRAPPSLFLGSFINETSMLAYLLHVAELPVEHPIVQNTADYYGIKLDKKLAKNQSNLNSVEEFSNSVYRSRCLGGTAALPLPLQSGRSIKAVSKTWFYKNSHTKTIDEKLRYYDTDEVIKQRGLLDTFSFNQYDDYLEAKAHVKDVRSKARLDREYWTNYIKEHGIEAAKMEIERIQTSKKRKREEEEGSESDSDDDEEGEVSETEAPVPVILAKGTPIVRKSNFYPLPPPDDNMLF